MDVGLENDTLEIPFSVNIMGSKCFVTFIYIFIKHRGVFGHI